MLNIANKYFFILAFCLAVSINTKAQSWQKTESGLKTEINSINVEVQFYSPSIARIIKSPVGPISIPLNRKHEVVSCFNSLYFFSDRLGK